MPDVQLSLNVDTHPALAHVTDGGVLAATLDLKVGVHVPGNLQPGDQLMVAISNADGELIASAEAEVGTVAFVPIKDDGVVIGTERLHKAKLA